MALGYFMGPKIIIDCVVDGTLLHIPLPLGAKNTVDSEIFVRILFWRIALKDILLMWKIRNYGKIYLYQ